MESIWRTAVLFENTACSAGGAPKEIQLCHSHIRNCLLADKAYGNGVAYALGIAMSEVHN
jgi:catalase